MFVAFELLVIGLFVAFEFDVVEFVVVELVVVELVVELLVVAGVETFIGVDVFAGLLVFVLLLLLVFVFVASPGQAAPKMPKAKTAERAKVFFICIYILLSSSKINYICNCFYTAVFPKVIIGTLDNIKT